MKIKPAKGMVYVELLGRETVSAGGIFVGADGAEDFIKAKILAVGTPDRLEGQQPSVGNIIIMATSHKGITIEKHKELIPDSMILAFMEE